jgi:hypothetical protein
MQRFWSKRSFRIHAAVLAAAVVLTLVCWHWGIWSYRDFLAYQEVCRCPVGEDLWHGRIRPGQDLGTFDAEHPPHRTRRFGPFVMLTYYAVWPSDGLQMEGLTVTAKDGRLVHAEAAGCTWGRVFFAMSPADRVEFGRAFERDLYSRHPEWRRR